MAQRIRVGLIGAGMIAEVHVQSLRRVYGVDVEIAAVCARGDKVVDFARRHGIARAHRDWRELLGDRTIDVIDICTPPNLHAAMIVEAMQAGHHVICEKPFTGYFGRPGDAQPIGRALSKALMAERVAEEVAAARRAIEASGQLFLYAENWVYAPAVSKCTEILRATRDKITFMQAAESHSGSHAPHAARWDQSGGGTLMRQGCHPLSALLHLKQVEAAARGETISLKSVVADVGNIGDGLPEADHRYVASRPVDVEDWASLTLTFSDGSKANVRSSDALLGGIRNQVEVFTSGGVVKADICPNDGLLTYLTDEDKLAGVHITEKIDRKTGWQFVCLDEQRVRGYHAEMQDFIECAAEGRQPLSGLDLACDVTRVIYAAYRSAEEGRRVDL